MKPIGGWAPLQSRGMAFELRTKTSKELLKELEEMKAAGFSAAECRDTFTLEELKAAGFSAPECRDANFTLEEIKAAGGEASGTVDGYAAIVAAAGS